ncbi:hypothetical protein [Sinomicrobium pectinilyticum]|uniref:hypothetical protein n=1 Tax=Sinomicrobium pectinilyticum TaxID=1084421 RepID=UPI001473BBC5|nr:hypothetical protein [Sinomicrobium pectinilyticum]
MGKDKILCGTVSKNYVKMSPSLVTPGKILRIKPGPTLLIAEGAVKGDRPATHRNFM